MLVRVNFMDDAINVLMTRGRWNHVFNSSLLNASKIPMLYNRMQRTFVEIGNY